MRKIFILIQPIISLRQEVFQARRIEDKVNLSGTAIQVNTFDEYHTYEEDVVNLMGSGRGWYGELMNGPWNFFMAI